MSLEIADRVRETTATTGTGTLDLGGAVAGFQSFVAGIGDGNTCHYVIDNGTAWEVGIGTVTDASPDTLSRDTVISSSNAGSKINISGAAVVSVTLPGSKKHALEALGVSNIAENNIFLNPDFNSWIGGASFSAVASGDYYADVFRSFKSGSMVTGVARSTVVPTIAQSGHLSLYSVLHTVTTAVGSLSASNFWIPLQYAIEGYDFQRISQRDFTIGFWILAKKPGVYCIACRNSAPDRSYIAEYTVNDADTWEYKEVTIPASPAAGTWDYTTGAGLYISFTGAAGTNWQTTAGAWQTGNYLASTNQVNAADNTANILRLSQLRLYPGNIVLPFIGRSHQQEKDMIERYLPAWVADATQAPIGNGNAVNGSTGVYFLPFRTKTRSKITGIQISDATHFRVSQGDGTAIACTIVNYNRGSMYGIEIAAGVSSGLTAGQGSYIQINNTAGYLMGLGARL